MRVPTEDDAISRHEVGAQALMLDWEQGQAALRQLHASPYQFGYEPAGSRYQDLLRLAQRWCSYATLVMQDFRWTSHALAATQELRPWHAADVSSLEWPGTQVSKAAKVMVFRFEAGLLRCWAAWLDGSTSGNNRTYPKTCASSDRPENLGSSLSLTRATAG